MWQIIRELVADGVTVFLTTQYLEEADELADRIAVLNDGKIAAEGTADELKRLIPGGHVRLRFTDPAAYQRGRRSPCATSPATTRPSSLQIPSDGSQRELRAILDRLDTGRHRGRRTDRPHPRPRRRVLRPHRRHHRPPPPSQPKETVR